MLGEARRVKRRGSGGRREDGPRNGEGAWISEVAGADKARVAREGRGVTAFCAGQGHLGNWIPGRTLSATVETQPLAVPQFLQMQREGSGSRGS